MLCSTRLSLLAKNGTREAEGREVLFWQHHMAHDMLSLQSRQGLLFLKLVLNSVLRHEAVKQFKSSRKRCYVLRRLLRQGG